MRNNSKMDYQSAEEDSKVEHKRRMDVPQRVLSVTRMKLPLAWSMRCRQVCKSARMSACKLAEELVRKSHLEKELGPRKLILAQYPSRGILEWKF